MCWWNFIKFPRSTSGKQVKISFMMDGILTADEKRGWVAKTDVYVFGDEAQDTEMLLLARKTKKHARIKESREGYQFACEILGLNPEHALKASIRKTKK